MKASDRTVTDEDRYWHSQSRLYQRGALDRTRAAAAAWTTTLTAVTGFFGIVTFFKGPEDVMALAGPARVVIGILALAVLLTALIAVGLGTLAAQGRIMATYTTADEIRERTRAEQHTAVRRLRASRLFALGALVLLVGTVATAWYAPRPTSALVVTWTDGTTLCVPSAARSFGPQLPAERIARLRSVPRCP
nr:hypothetical protein [uncultured Actinoplanes sp.]